MAAPNSSDTLNNIPYTVEHPEFKDLRADKKTITKNKKRKTRLKKLNRRPQRRDKVYVSGDMDEHNGFDPIKMIEQRSEDELSAGSINEFCVDDDFSDDSDKENDDDDSHLNEHELIKSGKADWLDESNIICGKRKRRPPPTRYVPDNYADLIIGDDELSDDLSSADECADDDSEFEIDEEDEEYADDDSEFEIDEEEDEEYSDSN